MVSLGLILLFSGLIVASLISRGRNLVVSFLLWYLLVLKSNFE